MIRNLEVLLADYFFDDWALIISICSLTLTRFYKLNTNVDLEIDFILQCMCNNIIIPFSLSRAEAVDY